MTNLSLKQLINRVRVEHDYSPMAGILAERFIMHIAQGNWLGIDFHDRIFAQRDINGDIVKRGGEFEIEDRMQAIQIAEQVVPDIWDRANENLLKSAIDNAT